MRNSPYLKEYRLSDIIAAIQVLGPLKWQSLKNADWDELLGPAQSAEGLRWEEVFKEHPEFFRFEDSPQKVSIRWRFAYDKNFDARTGRAYTPEEMAELTDEAKKKLDLTRKPLSTDEIKALMDTAMELYSRAFLEKQERRWWVPVVSSFIGGILGAILGVILKH